MGAPALRRKLSVMVSVKAVRPTTNPYIVQLIAGLGQEATVHTFSWRRALFGRVDVFHIHWPEAVFARDRRWVSEVWAFVFALVLIRLRLGRVAIVRTLHNVSPHEAVSPLASAVLALCDRVTTSWIRLNPDTVTPPGARVYTILHGHYREWFAPWAGSSTRRGQLVMFGQVRRYKGVLELLEAFRHVEDPEIRLRIVGRPNPESFANDVEAAAAADSRVDLHLSFIDDERLASEIGSAELIVLPYRRLHNSGAALLALSLDRPVLVPDGIETRRLADEVGGGWVHRFGSSVQRTGGPITTGKISSADILQAIAAVRAESSHRHSRAERPDLTGREWHDATARHIQVYLEAVEAVATRTRRGHTRRRRGPTLR